MSELTEKKQTELLNAELVEHEKFAQPLLEDDEEFLFNESDEGSDNEQNSGFGSSEDESVSLSDIENIENGTENSSENGEFEQHGDQETDMFPFPSEIFFLLYCYAHNVSRPKVN